MANYEQKNIPVGSRSYDYRKTGAGAFPTDPSTVAEGAALTIVADNTLALAGANDKVTHFFRLYDPGADKVSAWGEGVGKISGVPANGTIAKGAAVVGYSDTDRGKVKEATLTFSNTPTVQELETATKIVANQKWVCTASASGSCTLEPSP